MPTVIHFVGGESIVVTAGTDALRPKLLADPWVEVEVAGGGRAHVNGAQVTHLVERGERGGHPPGTSVYPERRQRS